MLKLSGEALMGKKDFGIDLEIALRRVPNSPVKTIE